MSGRFPIHVITTTLAAVLLLSTLAEPAASQRRAWDERNETGQGFFQVGHMSLDLDDLNASLTGAEYPSLDDGFLTLGGAGYGNPGRFLVGGEGHGLLGSEVTTADGTRQLRLGGGYGLFRLGYLAVAGNRLDVFPLLGIGGGGMGLRITERSTPSFDDVLENPERSSTLSTAMLLLDASLGMNYRIVVQGGEDGEVGGLLIGLQAGYTFAPRKSSWNLDGINTVAGGPELGIEGVHVRVSIGGWGGREADDR